MTATAAISQDDLIRAAMFAANHPSETHATAYAEAFAAYVAQGELDKFQARELNREVRREVEALAPSGARCTYVVDEVEGPHPGCAEFMDRAEEIPCGAEGAVRFAVSVPRYGMLAARHEVACRAHASAMRTMYTDVDRDQGDTRMTSFELLGCAKAPYRDDAHTILNVSAGKLHPDSVMRCQHCDLQTTGADYARLTGQVLMTKAAPAYHVHRFTATSTRDEVLAAAGTQVEAATFMHALERGPLLRRGKVVSARRTAMWTGDGQRMIYAPQELGERHTEIYPVMAAGSELRAAR